MAGLLVDLIDFGQEFQRLADAELLSPGLEGAYILGQAAATEADPGAQETVPDTGVHADGPG